MMPLRLSFFLLLGLGFTASLPAAEPVPSSSNACIMPARMPVSVCEAGGAFLCVNTPPGGVKEDFVVIKGRLHLQKTGLGHFSVAVQQEYTKQLNNISLSSPLQNDCWKAPLTAEKNFCLEEGGAYAVRVPLADLGAHTLFIAASSLQGDSMQTTVRTSRVIAPTVTPDVITYDPDIAAGRAGSARHVRVVLDLLAGCGESKETCDFIGASTGGVFVTVENRMDAVPPKSIRCETNTIQGGAGRFAIGVPVEPGNNRITIRICNAATGFDSKMCPTLLSPAFHVEGGRGRVEILPPLSDGPFLWDKTKYPTVPLRFRIQGLDPEKCDDTVRVSMNRTALPKICPNAEGVYETDLAPEEGYNIVAIEAALPDRKLAEAVPFGWGLPFSPFDSNGDVRSGSGLYLPRALQLWLAEGFFNQTLMPPLQTFIASETFGTWLAEAAENAGREEIRQAAPETAGRPSYCKGGGATDLRMKVTQPPRIGRVKVGPFRFSESRAEISLHAEDVSVGIQLYKDENSDGVPDIDPLPLKISFKQLVATPVLLNGGVFSSPHTDCDYKRSGACLKMPAFLVPKNFTGNASPAGAFVVCDRSQKISPKMDKICHAMNVVDRVTGGFLQEKILDTINGVYACAATAALKRGGAVSKNWGKFGFTGEAGLDGVEIGQGGMMLFVKTRFGSQEMLAAWPEELRKRGAGILVPSGLSRPLIFSSDPREISAGIALPVVSQMFWGLEGMGQGLVIDDGFFKKMGLDFSAVCDGENTEPNALCNIRPRAQEILGDPISRFGYLDPKAPLHLVLNPSAAFPLRLHVADALGLLQVEFADWDLAIESGGVRYVAARLSAKIGLQVLAPDFDPDRPDLLKAGLRIVAEKSRFWVAEKEGSNTTVIPGTVLLSRLEQILKLALDNYSKPGKEILFSVPRGFDFSTIGFNLPKLVWGADGFQLGWDASGDRLLLQSVPHLQ